jgi:hypothetical protein
MGCLDVNGTMVSVNVGFLNMAVLKPVGVLCMNRSRKFSVQLSSCSAVNRSLGCKELKSFSILCMSDWLGSNIIRMSSTYLQ